MPTCLTFKFSYMVSPLFIFFYAMVLFPDTTCQDSSDYKKKIEDTLLFFNIKDSSRNRIYYESCDLISIGKDIYGREQFLDSNAANAFFKMKNNAKKDFINLKFISGFRSFDDQRGIIQRKLNANQPIELILKENKLPGYSEHHTGEAIDLISKELNSLSIDFENSKEFNWLEKNANSYGFYLSYPNDNKEGIMYEPWHWMFKKND